MLLEQPNEFLKHLYFNECLLNYIINFKELHLPSYHFFSRDRTCLVFLCVWSCWDFALSYIELQILQTNERKWQGIFINTFSSNTCVFFFFKI